jgi:uncharacterized membrane protein YhhN
MRRGLLAAYAVVAAVNVVGQLVDTEVVDRVTKPLLVPLLVALLLSGGRPTSRLARATLVGLLCCWLGDLALMGGDDWFLVGLLGFLAGQVAYCTAFATTWARNPIREHRVLVAPYVAWWVLLLVVLGPDLGGLVVPVAVYGAVLCSMAALALGVHRLTAIGALSFVASDSLLAATSLSDRLAFGGADALVMATYVVGQLLITLGVLAAAPPRPGSARGRPAATTSASATSAGRRTPGSAGR